MILQILKKSTFLLCAGSMLLFTSCNGEDTDGMDAENKATESVNDTPRNPPNLNGSGSQDVEGNSVNSPEKDGQQNSPLNIENSGEEGANLNPPHGEPGHDCAVPVGKPLPSASGVNTPSFNNSTNNSGVKLNPPHGEPGHDCAVQVGDPLN